MTAAAGAGALVVAERAGRSYVERAFAASPLKLLTPKNRGRAAWAFVSSYGGGLVDGDHLAIDVRVRAGARALLASQAQQKVYRGARGGAQRVEAAVEEGALFALVPDPVSCFRGARYAQTTRASIARGASAVVLDAITCGRRAYGERWAFDRVETRLEVLGDAGPIAIDATLLDATDGPIAPRMAEMDAIATLLLAGPETAASRALASRAHGTRERGLAIAASALGAGDAVMVRLASSSLERLLAEARALLVPVFDHLGDDPFARRT